MADTANVSEIGLALMFHIASSAWDKASSPVDTVTPAGTVSINCGSTIATFGQVQSRCREYFLWLAESQIVARRFSRGRHVLDQEFFEKRILRARNLRERRAANPRFHRLIWSESDGIPGLIVDRYDDVLVLQTLTLGMDLHKSLVAELLMQTPGSEEERHAQARMAEMHGLIERLTTWYEDVKRLETERLAALLALGAKVTKLLEAKDTVVGLVRGKKEG